MGKREVLIARSIPFLEEIKSRTPGRELEEWLNGVYGPSSSLYRELAELITAGVAEGWAANVEINGPRYRRSRISEPTADTAYFSITAVLMDSESPPNNPERVVRGDYHLHPYGELNMVVPLTLGAKLCGPNGWQGAGWTSPAPGSHHYPEVKGGAVIALFYLPAGRISYDIKPLSWEG